MDTPSAGLAGALKSEHPMAVAVLSNQGDQSISINQDAVLASSKRPGT